ncbi:uncharacterized protein BP01DRAFT_146923 [Aspergillus saccharolyticus JOP 1030-1]|uniref:Uncharacterized protein n=1 Tax=Aspergillus saccharolyticus JOP 1030-1 TaxID=1450539 RepID=A0A318ZLA4_9EURO|nr:hypothetical protein BP01DRAFT_146923 [Aspergillus saccharolyticus JOP 1030-1]PYH48391.1 hypothetical protein BP01DRAFT_146923 [Aspergillus saccharolyticus JOP 1030-1]
MASANQKIQWSTKRLPKRKTRQDGDAAVGGNEADSASNEAPPPASALASQLHQQLLPSPRSQPVGSLGFLVSTPGAPVASQSSPPTGFLGGRPHDQRQGAARGTRSSARKDLVSAFAWEALDIDKVKHTSTTTTTFIANPETPAQFTTPSRSSPVQSSKGHRHQQQQAEDRAADLSPSVCKMSRNRPRGPPVPRDNGLAANEETDMWNKILQDLRKAKEKNDKQKGLAEQIASLNEKIGREGGSKSSSSPVHMHCPLLQHSRFPISRCSRSLKIVRLAML